MSEVKTALLNIPELHKMKDEDKTRAQLLIELGQLRQKMSELEKSEDSHKRVMKDFQGEKEKFKVFVENSPLGVSLIDQEGSYKYVNPRFVEIFGYTYEDAPTGREWFKKAFPKPSYRRQVISAWINDQNKTKQGEARTQIFTVTCKDGSQKVIRFISMTMETGDQYIVYENVTEQKELQAQLIQSQKMEAIGRLAAGVAHDFNNVLMSIMGNSDLVLLSLGNDHPLQDNIMEIKKAAKSAASLTHQLLAFSRAQVLQPKIVDLNTVIMKLEKMMQRLIREDIELRTIFAPGLPNIKADPGQIEQVIMNLAVNARDAMPQGGKLTIETANVNLDGDYFQNHGIKGVPGDYVMMGISDNGFGMDKETCSRIFEPFFTTKEKGKGTGLGLATVYGIVKQSEGLIWVYSEPGHGTSFKIYFPSVEDKKEPEINESILKAHFKGSETLLVVEDNVMVLDSAMRVLQQYGYSILTAQNGEEALTVSKKHNGPIHMLITDVVMPLMGGPELKKHLTTLWPNLKVLYMSGYTDDAIVQHGLLERGINFLQKPFNPKRLIRRVREVLDS